MKKRRGRRQKEEGEKEIEECGGEVDEEGEDEFEWRLYASSASESIFRPRTYRHILFSPAMMISDDCGKRSVIMLSPI